MSGSRDREGLNVILRTEARPRAGLQKARNAAGNGTVTLKFDVEQNYPVLLDRWDCVLTKSGLDVTRGLEIQQALWVDVVMVTCFCFPVLQGLGK